MDRYSQMQSQQIEIFNLPCAKQQFADTQILVNSSQKIHINFFNEKSTGPERDSEFNRINKNILYGPSRNRKCTDTYSLILFLLFLAGAMLISSIGFELGDANKLIYPFDADGKQCGMDRDLQEYNYIYFNNPTRPHAKQYVCVKECPTRNYESIVQCAPNSKVLGERDNCIQNPTFIVYQSVPYVRTCLPVETSYQILIKDLLIQSSFEKRVIDLQNAQYLQLVAIFIMLMLGFILLQNSRVITSIAIWIGQISVIALLVLVVVNAVPSESRDDQNPLLRDYNWELLLLGMGAITCLGVIFLYTALKCQRIKIATSLMKIGSDFLKNMWCSMIIPLMFLSVFMGILIFWTQGCLYLFSVGQKSNDETAYINTPFNQMRWNASYRNLLIYMVAFIVWVSLTLQNLSYFITSSSSVIWYFAQKNDQKAPNNTNLISMKRSLTHFGSIAISSLLIPMAAGARVLLWPFYKCCSRVHLAEEQTVFRRCMTGFIKKYETYLKESNKFGLIQMALEGKSFFRSVQNANLILLNCRSQVKAFVGSGSILQHCLQYTLTLFPTSICVLMMTKFDKQYLTVYSPLYVALIILFISYFISSFFMNVYGAAIDSVLYCYLVDYHLSQEIGAMPLNVPSSLQELIQSGLFELHSKTPKKKSYK